MLAGCSVRESKAPTRLAGEGTELTACFTFELQRPHSFSAQRCAQSNAMADSLPLTPRSNTDPEGENGLSLTESHGISINLPHGAHEGRPPVVKHMSVE